MNDPLRRLFALLLLLAAAPLAADDVSMPADIAKVMEQSNLVYSFGIGTGHIKKPLAKLECRARDSHERVVVDSEGRHLVAWPAKEEARPHFEKAEEHYAAKRLAEAGAEYAEGLRLDPDYGPGWLFGGDVPYGQGNYEEALTFYRRALALDPTLAQAHRFAADALRELGHYGEAEEEYVQALSYDPSYSNVLDALESLGEKAGFTVFRLELSPPKGAIGELVEGTVEIGIDPAHLEELGYLNCKAVWRHEAVWRARKLGRDPAAEYAWTPQEERECVAHYYLGLYQQIEKRLKEEATKGEGKRKKRQVKISEEEVLAAGPPILRHLHAVMQAKLFDGFVLFTTIGQRCPMTFPLMPDEMRGALEQYIRRFVILRPTPG